MKRTLLLVTVCVLMCLPSLLFAQDARFSQYFNNPLMLNPAMAGNGIEYIRVTAIYRNQWAGMGTPFTTQGFAVDKVVNRIGIGAAITRNGAGDASIRTLNVIGNLAYHLPLGYEKRSVLSAGVQVGIVNKSFDPSKLTFDNQYNPDAGYDPSMSSGEDFTSTSVTRPDVNIGLSWQRGWLNKDVRFKPFLSIGYSHITQPEETFILDATRVQIKSTIYGGAGYLVKSNLELRPTVMLLNQGTAKETTFGTLVNYQLDNKNSVQLGAYHRMEDAVIAYAGYQMNQLFVGMSYDVNTSELSKSGKGNNAFEISLTYSPRPRKKKEPKEEKKPAPRADEMSAMDAMAIQNVTAEIPDSLSFVALPAPVADAKEKETPAEISPIAEVVTEEVPVIVQAPVTETVPEVVKEVVPVKITAPATENVPEAVKEEAPVTEVIPVVTEPASIVIPEIITQKAPVAEPVQDFDEDGVVDTDDECPYIKGGANTKGCPDSDNDGLIDMKDDCPMESGPVTNKGCPDPNKPVTRNNQELVKKYDNILFASGLTKMTTDDIFDIIERAIDMMYADKTTKVILSGHTDSEGDAYQNMILSQARANVVRAYMIRQGIDESRIETVAYGETMPLENNTSAKGKQLNRRVEINILKK